MVDLYSMSSGKVQKGRTTGSSSTATATYVNIDPVNPAFAKTLGFLTGTNSTGTTYTQRPFFPGVTADGTQLALGNLTRADTVEWQVVG